MGGSTAAPRREGVSGSILSNGAERSRKQLAIGRDTLIG